MTTTRDQTLTELKRRRGHGLTWPELADLLDLHHGQASGVLSRLHQSGLVERLVEERSGASVYVLPQYVMGRPRIAHKANRAPDVRAAVQALLAALDAQEAALEPIVAEIDGPTGYLVVLYWRRLTTA